MGRQSKAIGENLRKATERVVTSIVLDIDANLRRSPARGGTPVDTGHARANWVPSVGAAHAAVVQGNGAHEAGVGAVLAYKLGDGACWISNAVPYIQALNDGHSAQQPAGFIERAIDEALAKARQKFGNQRISIDTVENLGAELATNLAGAYSPFGGD